MPDIVYAISMVSRYIANPRKTRWEVVEAILRYLKGTPDHELVFGTRKSCSVVGYYDSDMLELETEGKQPWTTCSLLEVQLLVGEYKVAVCGSIIYYRSGVDCCS